MHKTPEERAIHPITQEDLTREHIDQELLEEFEAAANVLRRFNLIDEFGKELLRVREKNAQKIDLSKEEISRNDD